MTTTLTISPMKNAQKLNEIGEELARVYKVSHLPLISRRKTDIEDLWSFPMNTDFTGRTIAAAFSQKEKQ